jgi:hypothetical protein
MHMVIFLGSWNATQHRQNFALSWDPSAQVPDLSKPYRLP